MVYKGFFLTDQPCEWLITESDCVPYTVLLYAGISGMFYSQTGVLIERGIATFASNYTTALSRRIGVTISTVVVLLSFITYRTIMWDDPLDGYVLTCFVPSAHSAHRANWFLFICVCLTFFNLIASMAVMYYNKVLEYRIRYKLRERFKKREAIDSTHTICIVSLSQFILTLSYSLGLLLLRCNINQMQISTFLALVVWIYTVPYSALLFPVILIFRIRATKVLRTRKIQDITTIQTDHIEQIQNIWNTSNF
ncbi:hypothetical protein L3Y34_016990 [Caenorhabditis briggsae]|uniref:Uncharacterized protein n=1 Tax=Caenorhabditis briggsae TaxID=6238 RepID=A0AAE9DHQ8_CAEBR|nr:hypothetical protein L3Y34_016990 [Caenorhabditis briggsae]